MSAWPTDPVIYELNTAAWLQDVGKRVGHSITLATVPYAEWDRVTPDGVDAVWLMGIWERSPLGLALALKQPELVQAFRNALPNLAERDVIGSAYCIRSYEVDKRFGGIAALAKARRALAERGVRLVVDFVPNHVAPDHAWLRQHPEYFVTGTPEDLEHDPAAFFSIGKEVIARGRDPFFPPWPDVAQLNAFAPGLRQAAIDTLSDIAQRADGIRVDMAMLMLNSVFSRTWGERAGPVPATEYWSDVIGAVRSAHPDFLFTAEAYWDLEWDLQQLGFDHCYDKRLYDRMLHDGPQAVRSHLQADLGFQRGLLRFLENHDEPRAAAELTPDRERAAAVSVATLPGATLWHEGQFEGAHARLPVFLARRPDEDCDVGLRDFHLRLISAAPEVRHGDWRLCDVTGWPEDRSGEQLLAWCWADEGHRALVVVNLADAPATGRVRLPWDDLAGHSCQFDDVLNGDHFERDGDELQTDGLYVHLPPWGFHVLKGHEPVSESSEPEEVPPD